ncbi:MAG: hypothetical protein KF816_17420 [Melioribacteraceae bacterium]|nr:hypothetical protein [Melioribacteraceae bacterium]
MSARSSYHYRQRTGFAAGVELVFRLPGTAANPPRRKMFIVNSIARRCSSAGTEAE